MIKTIIYDIGNVLMSWDWTGHTKRLFGEELGKKVFDATAGSPFWEELDRGVLQLEDVIDGMCRQVPELEEQIRYAFTHTEGVSEPRDYAIPWVQEMKEKGYRVLYLSNYSIWAMMMNPKSLAFIPHMDGGVFSCYEKLVKPDMAIYWKICKNYDLDPAQCLFLDDTMVNVRAAITFGMHSLQFKDYETSYPEIMNYLQEH